MPITTADELALHLARLEEEQETGVPSAPAEATVAILKAEIETLVGQLRQQPEPNPFEHETACRQATHMVQSMALEPASQRGDTASNFATDDTQPLGRLGVYELLSKLGEGGMGAVYKARHAKLDKIVAVKVLPAQRMMDESSVARFEREMRAVGKLEHPNIVRAMDAGEVDGTHFLAMEYVQGVDLSQLVKQLGALPIADACEIVRQAAVGLDEAHDHGMVHRDIKPSNIMLCAVGKKKPPVVKILDMGLALLGDAFLPDAKGLTTTGQVMGTLDYMAPEQGGDSHEVDIRADLYSLGATLYKLLCGETIYHGEKYQSPVQKMMALATHPAPRIDERRPGVPRELAAVVHRLLEKSPAARFPTPEAVAAALAPFCAGANLAALLSRAGLDVAPSSELSLSPTVASLSRPEVETDATGTMLPISSNIAVSNATRSAELQSRKPIATSAKRRAAPPWLPFAIGGGLLGFGGIIFAAIIFFLETPEGTLRVEINDKDVEVKVKDTNIVLSKADKEEITLTPGKKALVVTRGDFSFTTDKFELKKGEVTTVKVELLAGKVQAALKDGEHLGEMAVETTPPKIGPKPPEIGTMPAAAGKFALAFERGDEVVVAKVPHRETTVVTIEAWLSVDLTDDERIQTILRTPNGEIGMKRKALRFYTHHGHIEVPDVVPAQRRVHVAGVNDGSVRRLYLNGKLIGKTDEPGSVFPGGGTPDPELRIGWGYFRGVIDAARVSNNTRYDKDFTPPTEFKTDKDTFALYQFNEGQGDELKDSSGNGYHGKIQGAKWVKADRSSPGAGVALRTSAKDGELIQSALTLPKEDPVTVEGYVTLLEKPTEASYCYLFGVPYQLNLELEASGTFNIHSSGDDGKPVYANATSPHAVVLNQRYHVAGVRTEDKFLLFVDGKRVAECAVLFGVPRQFSFSNNLSVDLAEIRVSKVARYDKDFTPDLRFVPDADTLALYHCDEGAGTELKDSSGHNHHAKFEKAKWAKTPSGTADPANKTAATAQWLFDNRKLNKIDFDVDGQIHDLTALPAAPFAVRRLDFHSINNGGKLEEGDMPRLAAFADLEWLNLGRQPLTDAGLASLVPLKKLKWLCLADTQVTPAAAKTLREFPELESLHGPSTNEWLKELAGHPTLRTLHFYRADITPEAVTLFKAYPQLAELRFIECGLWPNEKLAMLKDCPHLSKLDLSYCPLGDGSIEVLSGFTKLTQLNVTETQITADGVTKLAAALPKCRIIWNDKDGVIEPKIRSALRFEGTKSYAELPLAVSDVTKPLTFETWIVHEDKEFRFNLRAGENTLHLLRHQEGYLRWNIVDAQGKARGLRVTLDLKPGALCHIAVTQQGETMQIFLNGKPVEGEHDQASMPNVRRLPSYIGYALPTDFGRADPASTVSAVRVSRSVRYREAFAPAATLTTDGETMLLYDFAEAAGTALHDAYGNFRHGNIVNAKWTKMGE